MKKIGILLTLALFAVSCKKEVVPKPKVMVKTPKHLTGKFANVKFDNEKDFYCGMDVNMGVSDTAHYKGKVYGFCAKVCKDEFLKMPEKYLAKK